MMAGIDKRRQLEIEIGAAFRDAEAIESLADELLVENTADNIQAAALRDIAWARHHAFEARLIIDRVFQRVNGGDFSLDDALSEMKMARGDVESVFRRIMKALLGGSDRTPNYDKILKHLPTLESRVQSAIRSIEVRQLELGS
jgi:hypothetical protein